MKATVSIPVKRLALVLNRTNKAAKRAQRHGLPVPSATVVDYYDEERHVVDRLARMRGHPDGRRTLRLPMARLEIDGFAPEIGEWTIVGFKWKTRLRIDGRPVTRTHASGSIPDHMKERDLCCDHCQQSRQRFHSLIVRKSDGQHEAEVGSTCLSAFTGRELGEGLLKGLMDQGTVLEAIEAASNWSFDDPDLDLNDEVIDILAVAVSHIREYGFVSSRDARDTDRTASWSNVKEEMAALKSGSDPDGICLVVQTDYEMAERIIESYQANLRDSDFENKVRHVFGAGVTSDADIAVLCGAASAYLKRIDREAANESARKRAEASRYVGSPGEKHAFDATVMKVKHIETAWGGMTVVTLIDENDNLLCWKTGTSPDLVEGDRYHFSGTIKAHDPCRYGEYKDLPETLLKNLKIKERYGKESLPETEKSISDEHSDDLERYLGL